MNSKRDGEDAYRWGSESIASEAARYFDATGSVAGKLTAFPRFVDRSTLSRFLVKYEVFKSNLNVEEVIIECGVFGGGGLYTFEQLSAISEPLNHKRKIVGFDSFSGFPSVSEHDLSTESPHAYEGNYHGTSLEELTRGAALYDTNRALGHIPRIELVQGDFVVTGPQYLEANPQTIVALLYLDFDLYEPTKTALECFASRMPRGAVIVFDQAGSSAFPGESQALMDTLDMSKVRLQRSSTTSISWVVLQGDEARG